MELFGVYVSGTALVVMVGEALVAALLLVAVLFAKRHRGKNHHWTMLSAFLLDLAVMKPIMYAQAFSGAFGEFPYEGTQILPHMLLSWVTVIAGLAAIALGFKYRLKREDNMYLPPKGQVHRVAGGIFIVAWFAAYLSGLYIFSRLYI